MTEKDVDPLVAETLKYLDFVVKSGWYYGVGSRNKPTGNIFQIAATLIRSQSERIAALEAAIAECDRQAEKTEALLDPHIAWEGQPPKAYAEIEARLADALAALKPFVTYTPEDVLDGNGRFVLVKTTEGGGGWFGSEDFRRARATLSRLTAAEKSRDKPKLSDLLEGQGRVRELPHASEVHATLQGVAAETLSNAIEGGR